MPCALAVYCQAPLPCMQANAPLGLFPRLAICLQSWPFHHRADAPFIAPCLLVGVTDWGVQSDTVLDVFSFLFT